MPDFAPNATPRYIAGYNSVGRQHHVTMRVFRGTSMVDGVAAARSMLHDFFNAVASSLPNDFTWTDAVWIPQDSDISVPADPPPAVTGAQLLANFSKQDSITHLTFSGKGTAGGKVSFKIFGVQFDPDALPAGTASDFIFHAGEVATIDAARSVLDGESNLAAIDNTHPIMRSSVTLKVNDHWLKKVRVGS